MPPQFRIAERFPIYAVGGAYAAVFGIGLVLLLLPLAGALVWIHLLLVPIGMALAALAARFATSYFQKRLEARLQPG